MPKNLAPSESQGVTHTTPADGNVFADLKLPNPELLLLKSGLQSAVVDMVKARGLTQAEMARLLGLRQPHVSALLAGKFASITLDRLVRCLMALGADLAVRVALPAHAGAAGRARIQLPAPAEELAGVPTPKPRRVAERTTDTTARRATRSGS